MTVRALDGVAQMKRDLHDGPLQNVFATMIRLDVMAQQAPPEFADELRTLSALQGRIIRQMREVCQDPRAWTESRTAIGEIDVAVADATVALGFPPTCTIDPTFDEIDDQSLVHDVVQTVRECLSNIARHAGATSAQVRLTVGTSHLRLEISDNGIGIPPNARRGNGLANLRSRAEDRGGVCTFDTPLLGGTAITWCVPLDANRPSTQEERVTRPAFDACLSSS